MKVLNYSAVTDGHKMSSPGSWAGWRRNFAFQHFSSLKCQFCLYLALNKQDKQFVQPKLRIICILFSLVLMLPLVGCQMKTTNIHIIDIYIKHDLRQSTNIKLDFQSIGTSLDHYQIVIMIKQLRVINWISHYH